MFPVLTLLTVESLKLHRKSWKLYLLAKTKTGKIKVARKQRCAEGQYYRKEKKFDGKEKKTYKDTVRGLVDNGARIWFSLKAWQVPGWNSRLSPIWHFSKLNYWLSTEWVKNLLPHKTYTRTLQTARNYLLGHGQFRDKMGKSKQ